jgi:hypothetical protein
VVIAVILVAALATFNNYVPLYKSAKLSNKSERYFAGRFRSGMFYIRRIQ